MERVSLTQNVLVLTLPFDVSNNYMLIDQYNRINETSMDKLRSWSSVMQMNWENIARSLGITKGRVFCACVYDDVGPGRGD